MHQRFQRVVALKGAPPPPEKTAGLPTVPVGLMLIEIGGTVLAHLLCDGVAPARRRTGRRALIEDIR